MQTIITYRDSTYDTADSEEKAKKQVHQLSPQHPVMTDQEAEILALQYLEIMESL